MADKKKPRKQIAPRLANGEKRVPYAHGMPPNLKQGMFLIAFSRGKSLSWVLEEAITRRFHKELSKHNVQPPEYIQRKKR